MDYEQMSKKLSDEIKTCIDKYSFRGLTSLDTVYVLNDILEELIGDREDV